MSSKVITTNHRSHLISPHLTSQIQLILDGVKILSDYSTLPFVLTDAYAKNVQVTNQDSNTVCQRERARAHTL